jgi:branched-subunit amino acid transport protein
MLPPLPDWAVIVYLSGIPVAFLAAMVVIYLNEGRPSDAFEWFGLMATVVLVAFASIIWPAVLVTFIIIGLGAMAQVYVRH